MPVKDMAYGKLETRKSKDRLNSVGALNKDGISVAFEENVATAIKNRNVLFEASLLGNLYRLLDEPILPNISSNYMFSAHDAGSTTEVSPPADGISRIPQNDAELWHSRLAHASYNNISRLPNIPQKPKAIRKGEYACEACLAGKMKEYFS